MRRRFVPWLVVPLLLAVAVPAAAPGTEAPTAVRSRADRLASADWVPLRGRIRVGRTWGHSGSHGYPAIDFEIPGKSEPVFAAGPGTVLVAEDDCPDTTASGAHADCNGGRGNVVEIVHPDGRRSRYLHLRHGSVPVEPGVHVCRGCRIGRSGWSGNVSPLGPQGGHLHYEELRGYRIVDPGRMFARSPSGRVAHPTGGATWRQVGGEGLTFRNAGFPDPGPAPTATCLGWAATRIGTPGGDTIRGSPGPDIMFGGDGSDSMYGEGGDDRVCGGAGDDLLVGGSTQDDIDGGDGIDTCFQEGEGGPQRADDGSFASCERPLYELTVEVGCCGSVVTSEPQGISCPTDCLESYPTHTVVTLTVTPPVPRPRPWSGCDVSQGATCRVTMVGPRRVRV